MLSSFSKSLTQHYKDWSVKALSLAVKPTVIGKTPVLEDALTFYVLEEYSRSNSLLLEKQVQALGLPSALAPVVSGQVNEASAVIFLKHKDKNTLSPKLARLVKACLDNPSLKINLVPVTILWGRLPEKEESWFKLLMADEWQVPSVPKQLFNIGVMGRDSFVQFYDPKVLQVLIKEAASPNLALAISERLSGYLSKQRASILGPDLSDKRNIVVGIMRSALVQDAIAKKSLETGKPLNAIKKEAQAYVHEIASDYSYSVVRVLERFLMWLWTQLYDGVQVRYFDRVRKLAPDCQIIYVPCHRSHMDYLLLSYIIQTKGLRVPHVAAGANLNLPILGEILRSGGAFFLRRSFRDNPLYGTVFKEYLHNLMQRGAPIEYFIEGGRSRTGRLLSPKLGMLAMTVQSHLRHPNKPVVFIPTYISYERIMEGATYVGELKGKPKESENLLHLLKTARKIERSFGAVQLSFGKPLYLQDFMQKFGVHTYHDDPSDMVQNLAVKILQHINQTAVITPVSLVALVLLSAPKAVLGKVECLSQLALYQAIARLLPYDEDIATTELSPEAMLAYAKKLKLIETKTHALGDLVAVADKQAPMLSYFKNNVLHLFIIPSLLAALIKKNRRIAESELHELVRLLYPFLQSELFLKYSQKHIDDISEQALQTLIDLNLAQRVKDGVIVAAQSSENEQRLVLLANPAEQSLERYFMTLTLLAKEGSGSVSLSQVVNMCHLVAQRLSALYGEDLPDGFDKALFAGFLNTLIRIGYAKEDNGMLLFDERIQTIAQYARLVLPASTLNILAHATKIDLV